MYLNHKCAEHKHTGIKMISTQTFNNSSNQHKPCLFKLHGVWHIKLGKYHINLTISIF